MAALWGTSLEKGQWTLPTFLSERKLSTSSHLDARYFSSSLYATGAFQDPTTVLELRGSLSKSMCGFFKVFLQTHLMRTYLLGIGTLGWGSWCEAGTPCSQDIPPEFLSTTPRCGTSTFHVHTPPTSLDGCGFFDSVVIRLLFNPVSDGSE